MTREEIDHCKAELAPIIKAIRKWFGKDRADEHFKNVLEYYDMYNEETKEIFGI